MGKQAVVSGDGTGIGAARLLSTMDVVTAVLLTGQILSVDGGIVIGR
jgi:hypothetical protein